MADVPPHPMQSIVLDDSGTPRFRANKIVRFLIDWASSRGIDMNALAVMPFDADDRTQFAQLIGYSVSGFGDLSYADPTAVAHADQIAHDLTRRKK